jgi:hypothetical protein
MINACFIGVFTFEILCRFFAKDFNLYIKDIINKLDIILIWLAIANLFVRNDVDIDIQFRKSLNAVSVAYQLLRTYKIIKYL